MAASLNSLLGFPSILQANYCNLSRSASLQNAPHYPSSFQMLGLKRCVPVTRQNLFLLVAKSDRLERGVSYTDSVNAEGSYSEAITPTVTTSSFESSKTEVEVQPSGQTESAAQEAKVSNGSATSANLQQEAASSSPKPTLKRSPLTAREKLRAARVLSRYNESKASSKPQLGSKLIEALRESEKGKKRPGLPEAPTNLFDDSKRGMPKPGWTFEFPGGFDVFLLVFSFVFISTVMFATTYIVWKVGAIHFNEY
ncbi:hypothetical protein FXO38_20075 [Capsicum annuum]|uniref:uncharacterized protein LOC107863491 n=1 Tax=Capsicum annuum TaxID=4072 RepID=UPI0007BFBF9D|nr:uncharacterized protein LOC107863491 [Capsicum annuum]KAF3644623.1 hypothetical protein FXO38_20075 [Capsicum annuum]